MGARKSEAGEGEIRSADFAELLDVSLVQIAKLVREGWIPRTAKPGVLNLRDAIRGAFKYQRDESRRTSMSAAGARIRDARALEAEMRIAEKNKTLMQTVDVIEVMTEIFDALKSSFIGLPANLTRDLSLRRKFEDAIDAALTKAADQIDALANGLDESHFVFPTDAKTQSPSATGNRASRRLQKAPCAKASSGPLINARQRPPPKRRHRTCGLIARRKRKLQTR